MIDAKQAILIARAKAAEVLSETQTNVEEIERESYKGREPGASRSASRWMCLIWHPALGLSGRSSTSFLVDVETGELMAMKIREFTSQ